MSILHPEEHRKCRPCGNTWYAERYLTKPSLISPLPYSGSFNIGRVADAQQKIRAWEKYTHCSGCGSSKVDTIARPTAVKKGPGIVESFKIAWRNEFGKK